MAVVSPSSIVGSHKQQLDFLVSESSKDDDATSLARMQRFIIEAVTSPIRTRYESEASINYRYIENDFYSAEELAEFEERGQPPSRRNEAAPILERLQGQFIQTRQTVTYLGRNTPADDPVAAVMQDVTRWSDQLNNFEFEEQDMTWDGLVGGVGWLKASIITNELGQKMTKWRALNPFRVYKDPMSVKYDPNEDAKYIVEGSWMELEDLLTLLPDKEDLILNYVQQGMSYGSPDSGQIAQSLQNESFLPGAMYGISVQRNNARKRVRPFEVWYKRKIRVNYILDEDGVVAVPIPLDSKSAKTLLKQLDNRFTIQTEFQDRMYVGIVLGSVLLHHDVSEHDTNLFPYVPFYSGIHKNGSPLALASRLIPINELINKLESKAHALIANRQTIAEKSAIFDEEDFQKEKARPDGLMIVQDGSLSGGRVINTNNLDVGQGHMALLQEEKDAIQRAPGISNEAMGRPGEVRSGTGIARKQMMGTLITMPVQNNLRRTRYMKGRLAYELMKQYLTEEMAFQITDDPNAPKTVKITKGTVQAIKERLYDIVITEEKDYATLREQQTEMLMTVLPQLAQLGPAYVQLGIQLSDLRDKDGLIKLVQQQMQQGPILPKMAISGEWKDFTPEMKAFYALSALKSPELAQTFMQNSDDPAFLKKIQADLVTTQIKEGLRAEQERGRIDLQAMQTAIDGRVQLQQQFQDHQLQQQQMMMGQMNNQGDQSV